MAHYIVGVTGGIGSGKTTVTDLFAAAGAGVVDTDLIAHALTSAGGEAIPVLQDAFGDSILTVEGALDRPAMRQRIFSDPEAKQTLESILHPMIRSEAARQCAALSTPYAILSVPLLVESDHWQSQCDRILVVDCPEPLQIQRVMARNQMTEKDVLAIIAAQANREQRLAIADDLIVNDSAFTRLEALVRQLHSTYLGHSLKKPQAYH